MTVNNLLFNEYNAYYQRYLDQIDETTGLVSGLKKGKKRTTQFFDSIPEDKLLYRYAEEKWTPKEVLQHLIDTERVFAYRAFRIGRGDVTALANFDQDIYIEPSGANEKSRIELLEEYDLVRRHTISLVKSLSDKNLMNIGVASNHPISARAAAFINIGHEMWHIKIIKERYLV
ncbi:MAG: DinB family protein [Bacteroidota bacterium]